MPTSTANRAYAEKGPDERLDYGFDWAADPQQGGPWLDTDDTITTSTWSTVAGLTVETPGTHDDTSTAVFVSGGALGSTYPLVNQITTAEGRIASRTYVIHIKPR